MFELQSVLDAMQEVAGAVKKVSNIVEKVFGPQWQKKKADAEAYAIDTISETIRKNDDMKITYGAGEVSIEKKEFVRLLDNAINREIGEKVKQQQNLEAVLAHMLEELKDIKNISDEPVDEDFIDRLVENAKRANKKEMRFIWSKILAQEVVEPGSFSLRTLEVVRNLNQEEAKIFQRVAAIVLKRGKHYFLPAKQELTNKYGVNFETFLAMEECGLLQSYEALPLNFNIGANDKIGLESNEQVIVIANGSVVNRLLSVEAYKFTQAGQELLNILIPYSETKFVFEYASFLRNSNPNMKIEVYKILERKDNRDIIYSKEPMII